MKDKIVALFLIFFSCSLGWAAPPAGYVQNIEQERQEQFVEIKMEVPRLQREKTFNDYIFSPLNSEFKAKYREMFGENDTRSIIYRNMTEGGTLIYPLAFEKETQERKLFAEYMIKRLMDYHVDQYMRTNPEMKPVMEVKERIQNVNVEVTKEVKLKIHYNIVGNYADINVENPYIESKLALEMNPRSYGPSSILEARAWFHKDLNKLWRSSSYLAAIDGIAYSDLTRHFPNHLASFTFGGSTPYRSEGRSARQNYYTMSVRRTF
jgi:hypothetical protein